MKVVTAAVHIAGKKYIILDFSVPDYLSGVSAGWGVICPLRGKSYFGIVLCLKEQTDKVHLKEIEEVVTDGPTVPEDLIKLIYWIKDTYLVELSQAVSLVFPPYVQGSWVENLQLTANREDLIPLLTISPETEAIIEYMLKKKQFSKRTLENRFGKELTASCLEWMLNLGHLTDCRQYKLERRQRLKGNMVALTLSEPNLFIKANRRAPKQVSVIEKLIQHQGQYPLVPLLSETGVTRKTLKGLEAKAAVKVFHSFDQWNNNNEIELTSDQQSCLDEIFRPLQSQAFQAFLLHGVTGSGKTEVYLRAAQKTVSLGKKVIVIVPEIALSSQLIRYFQKSFGHRAVVLHSKLASLERYHTWNSIKKNEVDVVIGTRSAVFAPFTRLGLVIVDEEHDRSLKQDSSPRYHSTGVAAERCRLNDAVLVLGSATPSLETFLAAQQNSIKLLTMPRKLGSSSPLIRLIDMRDELRKGNTSILSYPLREAVGSRLNRGEQVIVFVNRRGYSSFVSCRTCGYVFKCDYCDISLTYHSMSNRLRCHYCGFSAVVPAECPDCRGRRIKGFGLGTEKVEEVLRLTFPEARILRLDSDSTTRAGEHDRIVQEVAKLKCDILIGTQMVTKGFDFPGVTLVCVIAADMDLNLPDFRAEERTFQLLTQVAGRAGRRDKRGEVFIQTYSPDRPGVAFLANDRQSEFFQFELCRRKALGYPPFSRLVRILFSSSSEFEALQAAERTAAGLSTLNIEYLGPAPAPVERIKSVYRWHIIVRNYREEFKFGLLEILEEEKRSFSNKVSMIIDVDPLNLM